MSKLTKEQFRSYIMEKTPVHDITPEEAFEAGKRGDMSNYDAAGKECTRAILRFAKRHPTDWTKIQLVYKGLRRFQKLKFLTPEDSQKYVEEKVLGENGISRYKKYPDWTYDRLRLHPSWNLKDSKDQLSQGITSAATDLLDELQDEELKREIDKIGPTGFMWSWAVNSAVYLSEVEK